MNRTDELTDRLIDGTLTDAEAAELEALLAADPDARARHLALLNLEAALRGLRADLDLAESTVARIEAERAERMVAAVMAELPRARSAERGVRIEEDKPSARSALRAPRSARRLVWIAAAAVAAALLVAVRLALPPAEGPLPPAPDLPRVTSVSGHVEVVGPDGAAAARPDQTLAPGQTLQTVGEESAAVLEFPDATRVEVHPDTAVQFVSAGAGEAAPRKLFLVQGQLTAVVADRTTAFAAGAAEVEARNGSFSLWSSGSGSARVEPRDGDVRVVRGGPAEPVVLAPGRAAFVRDESTPVRIEPPARPVAVPLGRLDFAALDVGFAPDGEVWAVSAKRWARWRPGTPDPGRTPFPPAVANDGLASWLTPDRRAVAICRTDDREGITVRELPSGEERGRVPARVSEPRFLCVGPDASWVATAGGKKPNDRRVRVWDVATGKERFAREWDASVTCLAASPDGRWLAAGLSDLGNDANNRVVVFDPSGGGQAFELPTRRKGVYALAFTGDGRQLAAGFNGVVQLWDVPGRKLLRTLDGFERVVTRLAYDPKGELVAAGTHDGQVWVWSARTGRRVRVIETGSRGVRALAFSADGKLLVTATNKAPVAVWEVAPAPADDPDPYA